MEECLYCKIINNEIPSYKVYEDDLVLAFLDIHPMSKGHTLVIPRKHAKDIFDIEEKCLERIISVAKKIAEKMKDGLGADGVNLYHASGINAEQTIFHFHLHVVPRRKDDSICFTRAGAREENIDRKELEETLSKLKIGG